MSPLRMASGQNNRNVVIVSWRQELNLSYSPGTASGFRGMPNRCRHTCRCRLDIDIHVSIELEIEMEIEMIDTDEI